MPKRPADRQRPRMTELIPLERVERTILILRGRRAILDSDLAALYGVTVSRLNEQVKRNIERFPQDFAFQISREESESLRSLRSQSAISKPGRGGRRYLPFAYTEHGALAVAYVLSSSKAIEMGVQVVRAFVQLRRFLATHHQFAAKLTELERQSVIYGKNTATLTEVVHSLMAAPEPTKRRIGFRRPGA